ncbi:hypothetical protein KE639_00045 [Streptomyces sp. V17-9]|nr:hypothetical protein KE639_00045 [Streptomyces sp. V17-9]
MDLAGEAAARAAQALASCTTFVLFQDGVKKGDLIGANPEGLKNLVQKGNTL